MKVYISGPISRIPDGNREAFYAAEANLIALGYEPVNPHKIHPFRGQRTWTGHLRADVAELVLCDCIYRLPGWVWSRGSWLEAFIAFALGIKRCRLGPLLLALRVI